MNVNVFSSYVSGGMARMALTAVLGLALCQTLPAQTGGTVPAAAQQSAVSSPDKVVQEINAVTQARCEEFERAWRNCFREARNRQRLTAFVGDTVGTFQALRQLHDRAFDPRATEARVATLFRQRVLNEEALISSMEQSVRHYLLALDEDDQALLIKLKIDRNVARTELSRSVLDPAVFKKPISAVIDATVTAVKNDLSRTAAAFIASEAISAGVKSAARKTGLIKSQPGTWKDFFNGLVIDIGVGIAVDAATDPTPRMVNDLESRLASAERTILDGQGNSPGLISTMRSVTLERMAARRKLIQR